VCGSVVCVKVPSCCRAGSFAVKQARAQGARQWRRTIGRGAKRRQAPTAACNRSGSAGGVAGTSGGGGGGGSCCVKADDGSTHSWRRAAEEEKEEEEDDDDDDGVRMKMEERPRQAHQSRAWVLFTSAFAAGKRDDHDGLGITQPVLHEPWVLAGWRTRALGINTTPQFIRKKGLDVSPNDEARTTGGRNGLVGFIWPSLARSQPPSSSLLSLTDFTLPPCTIAGDAQLWTPHVLTTAVFCCLYRRDWPS
jgi:hypothetical protein